jgi:hypothetical protein
MNQLARRFMAVYKNGRPAQRLRPCNAVVQMARHKFPPVRWNNFEHGKYIDHAPSPFSEGASLIIVAFTLLCPGPLMVLSTILTNLSQSVLEGFDQLAAQPLPLLSSPLQMEQTTTLVSTITSRLTYFSSNLSLLRSFANSPILYRGAVDHARSWVQKLESELREHEQEFERLLQAREDGEYILQIFVACDRGHVGAFPTATERGLWECHVAKVCEEMGLYEPQLGEDAIEALQVLAEGYVAWFLGCGYLLRSMVSEMSTDGG